MRKILLRCANWFIVSVCIWWQLLRYFFLNSDKAGVSAACYALALLHCIHTHTHTGDNQPFPLPQHDTVCMCMGLCVCKWRFLSMWQMGSHSSSSHGGGRKSLLDATTFTSPKNFLDGGGGFLLNWTDSRSVQVHWQDVPGCWNTKPGQIRPKRAKANQASDPKVCEKN